MVSDHLCFFPLHLSPHSFTSRRRRSICRHTTPERATDEDGAPSMRTEGRRLRGQSHKPCFTKQKTLLPFTPLPSFFTHPQESDGIERQGCDKGEIPRFDNDQTWLFVTPPALPTARSESSRLHRHCRPITAPNRRNHRRKEGRVEERIGGPTLDALIPSSSLSPSSSPILAILFLSSINNNCFLSYRRLFEKCRTLIQLFHSRLLSLILELSIQLHPVTQTHYVLHHDVRSTTNLSIIRHPHSTFFHISPFTRFPLVQAAVSPQIAGARPGLHPSVSRSQSKSRPHHQAQPQQHQPLFSTQLPLHLASDLAHPPPPQVRPGGLKRRRSSYPLAITPNTSAGDQFIWTIGGSQTSQTGSEPLPPVDLTNSGKADTNTNTKERKLNLPSMSQWPSESQQQQQQSQQSWESLLNLDNCFTPVSARDNPLSPKLPSSRKMNYEQMSQVGSSSRPILNGPTPSMSPSRIAQIGQDLAWKTILNSMVDVESVGEVSVAKLLHEVWKRGGGDLVSNRSSSRVQTRTKAYN